MKGQLSPVSPDTRPLRGQGDRTPGGYTPVSPVPPPMTESDLEAAVLDLAAILGWRRAHFRPALTRRGWRTPVSGDGAGFPDLILTRPPRIVAAELKSATGRMSPEQERWLADLAASGIETHIWRPIDLDNDSIVAVLRGGR